MEITKEAVERYAGSHTDFVWETLQNSFDSLLETWVVDIIRYKDYNRGTLHVDQFVYFQDEIWRVDEVSNYAATIENLNNGRRESISATSFIKVLTP